MTVADVMPFGWDLILAERQRLADTGGLLDRIIDELRASQCEKAARCYLLATDARQSLPESWPLSAGLWEPSDRLTNLVKAGALFLAEAERLDRARKPAADRLRRAALAVAEGLSNHLARQAVPAQREDHRP